MSKFSKLYKLIKITRLIRLVKLMKNRGKIVKKIGASMQLSESFERLAFFVMALFGLSHIFGCIWIFIGRSIGEEGWVTQNEFDDLPPFSLYLTALYFTFTTISTVGFGDISGGATSEKLYCILILFIGVLAYSFIAGSITSIIISYESTNHANH